MDHRHQASPGSVVSCLQPVQSHQSVAEQNRQAVFHLFSSTLVPRSGRSLSVLMLPGLRCLCHFNLTPVSGMRKCMSRGWRAHGRSDRGKHLSVYWLAPSPSRKSQATEPHVRGERMLAWQSWGSLGFSSLVQTHRCYLGRRWVSVLCSESQKGEAVWPWRPLPSRCTPGGQ